MNRNDNVVAIGDGYSTNEATGAMRYTSSSSGRSYVMRDDNGNETRAPGACFNCGGGPLEALLFISQRQFDSLNNRRRICFG